MRTIVHTVRVSIESQQLTLAKHTLYIASAAQWLERRSCKLGVGSSNLIGSRFFVNHHPELHRGTQRPRGPTKLSSQEGGLIPEPSDPKAGALTT